MSLFEKLKDAINQGREELATQVGRFKNKKFMEGTVAVCACISMASNDASDEEQKKMLSFIENSQELKIFNSFEIIEFFNKLSSGFSLDKDIGKGEAMKYISRLKDQPDAAQLAVRVGIAVAKSDGNFDESEKEMVREICVVLGFHPGDFQL